MKFIWVIPALLASGSVGGAVATALNQVWSMTTFWSLASIVFIILGFQCGGEWV